MLETPATTLHYPPVYSSGSGGDFVPQGTLGNILTFLIATTTRGWCYFHLVYAAKHCTTHRIAPRRRIIWYQILLRNRALPSFVAQISASFYHLVQNNHQRISPGSFEFNFLDCSWGQPVATSRAITESHALPHRSHWGQYLAQLALSVIIDLIKGVEVFVKDSHTKVLCM